MAASIGNAVGTVGGIKKASEGKKMQKKAQQFIDNFQWQELTNPFADLDVSTLGADLRKEEAGRMGATAMDSLGKAGARAIGVGAGRVNAENNNVTREIAANLDEQQKAIDMKTADYETVIQNMIESRQANELAGYGQMLNVGMAMKYQGMTDVMNAGNAQSEHNMDIFNTFGGAMGGGGGMSDRRLKKNINKIGVSESGLNIYSFEYIDSFYGEGVYQGVMSDEVPSDAVIKTGDGYDAVNYNKLDVEFKRIK